jgi:hypothetical protein
VAANLGRAARPGAHLYVSVEEVSEQLIDDKGYSQEDGWGYRHFLLRRLG